MQANSDPTIEAAADKAIKGQERRFVVSVQVDWGKDNTYGHPLSDLTPYVESVSTDRSLSGSAPEEILLIEGASAAELTVTVSGEYNGMPLTAVFSPYNGNSPLYNETPMGATIAYALGVETVLGTVWYQQFFGNVRTVSPDRAENTVEITALDFVEKMRYPIRFAPWAVTEYWAVRGYYRAQLCDTQWMLQSCLLNGGASATPYMPSGYALFWLPATGGHAPTVGIMDNTTVQQFPPTETSGVEMYTRTTGVPHPDAPEPSRRPLAFNALGTGEGRVNRYWVANRDQVGYDFVHILGLTLNTLDTTYKTIPAHAALKAFIGYGWAVQIVIGNGQVWSELVNDPDGASTVLKTSPKLTIPTTAESQRLWVLWDATDWGGLKVSVQCGTASTGWASMGNPLDNNGRNDDQLDGLIETRHGCSINDYSYGTMLYAPGSAAPNPALTTWDRYDAIFPASLDAGLNRFTFTPVIDGDDAWAVATQVAAAEMGSVFWDEYGRFHFWNYNTMKGKQSTLVRSLTLDEVSGLQITNSLDSVRNVWTVKTATKVAAIGPVYSSQSADEFYLPPTTGKDFPLNTSDAVCVEPWEWTTQGWQFTSLNDYTQLTAWEDSTPGGFVVSSFSPLPSGGPAVWHEMQYRSTLIEVQAFLNARGDLKVRVWNGHTFPIRFTTQNGAAAFRVPGTVIIDRGSGQYQWYDSPSISKYGTRNLLLEGDWYQDQFQSNKMLDTLAPRTTVPIPTTDAVTIAGDPRLQLGDCLEVRDPDGLGEQTKLQIYGIKRDWSIAHGLTDTLTVEMLRPPGTGIWDSQQYGRWDETFIWS